MGLNLTISDTDDEPKAEARPKHVNCGCGPAPPGGVSDPGLYVVSAAELRENPSAVLDAVALRRQTVHVVAAEPRRLPYFSWPVACPEGPVVAVILPLAAYEGLTRARDGLREL